MENNKDPIIGRISRINSEFLESATKVDKPNLLSRETLLDAVQVLTDECISISDHRCKDFVKKYQHNISYIKRLRVNITDFEIKNVIGKGNFGEVRLVREKQTGDFYAMKILNKFDYYQNCYQTERNIMILNKSLWLTSLQYAFYDRMYLFFIMDYHPGGNLLELLVRQGGTIPESAATFYVVEMLLALEDLHSMGFVYRNLNPSEILLDRCGHIKLADFGSAAKFNKEGRVTADPPFMKIFDYVAPEILQAIQLRDDCNFTNADEVFMRIKEAGFYKRKNLDNPKNRKLSCDKGDDLCSESILANNMEGCTVVVKDFPSYGVSCDLWSLGLIAYWLVVGHNPFSDLYPMVTLFQIKRFKGNLPLPSDIVVSEGYASLIRSLVTTAGGRPTLDDVKNLSLFTNVPFDAMKQQIPPYVTIIESMEDTSNFRVVEKTQKTLNIEPYKPKENFSGENLRFVGFTFTKDPYQYTFKEKRPRKDEVLNVLKEKIDTLQKKLEDQKEFDQKNGNLERRLEENKIKLDSIQVVRSNLEKDLAGSLAETSALKRTLELERKDRVELEKRALDLIKSAKSKWEASEKMKIESLNLEIDQQNEQIAHLATTNKMLNEQLQHALKIQNNHKECIERAEHLSRKSVIGLESRLEKVTFETQVTIAELQKKLTEETRQKNILVSNLEESKRTQNELKDGLKTSEKEYERWQVMMDDAAAKIKTLNEKIDTLESEVEKNVEYKKQISNLQEELGNRLKSIKELETSNQSLKDKVQEADCRLQSYAEDMKKVVNTVNNGVTVNEVQTQLAEERERNMMLLNQLQERGNRELHTKLWRLEKELSNAKIDRRILERELKEAREEIDQVSGKLRCIEESREETKIVHESALLELENINQRLSLDLMREKENCRVLQGQLESEKEKLEMEKSVLNELNNMMRSKDNQVNSLIKEVDLLKQERTNLEKDMENFERNKESFYDKLEKLHRENGEKTNECEKLQRELQNTNLNLDALREACTLLEGQVIEYEKINASYDNKQVALNNNIEKLIQDLCDAKNEIQEAKKSINEEKSLKILEETKRKRLEEDIESLQNERLSLKKQSLDYKMYSTGLSEQLSVAEEKLNNLEITVKMKEREIEDLKCELRYLKQESSEYLTRLNRYRDSMRKVKTQLSEESEENTILRQRIEENNKEMTERNVHYDEMELKFSATIQQQTKLIAYLQAQLTQHTAKKKTFADLLFGGPKKEAMPPVHLPLRYKNLETELLKERQRNRELSEVIRKLEVRCSASLGGKPVDGKEYELSNRKLLSPKKKKEQTVDSSDVESHGDVMDHISHRFESKFVMTSTRFITSFTKCAGCDETVKLGRACTACSRCNVICHVECKKLVTDVCELPAQHTDALTSTDKTRKYRIEEERVLIEGYVSVIGEDSCRSRRYAVLTDIFLKMYSESTEVSGTPLETFELKPSKVIEVQVSLESDISPPSYRTKIEHSQHRTLPALKIEVSSNNGHIPPTTSITILNDTAEEKEKWLSTLQRLFQDNVEPPKCEKVLEIPSDVTTNCLVDLTENIKVLGTDNGLYSYYEGDLIYINGLDKVHEITVMPTTIKVLMIVDDDRTLISCDLNHLINLAQCRSQCTEPQLKYQEVDVSTRDHIAIRGFHTLKASSSHKHQMVCVSTEQQLIILAYHLESSIFVTVKRLDTAEPARCALFTENSLIVGTDKFYKIDLGTFAAMEFLDPSDIELAQVKSCYEMGSFPLALLQIVKDPKEYLLCFKEFGVFVDRYGGSSRSKNLHSNRLPSTFHFSKPYLYITQFTSVEIVKITKKTCNERGEIENVKIELGRIKYLGANKKGIYVEGENIVKFIVGSTWLPSDDTFEKSSDSDRETIDWERNSNLEFSEESSNDDDSEIKKRVKFFK